MDNLNTNIEENKNNILDQQFNEEKIETKGLKLKKSTKDRLNHLQSKFEDGESMILSLLNQYDTMIVESDSKFADRKSEIDRFNYLIESLKSSFINSLDMAIFMEDRNNEKYTSEIKKKDKLITTMNESLNKVNEQLKTTELEVAKKDEELLDVKDSFSRVNLALITVEKELAEKSTLINNLQEHISSLGEVIQENKTYNNENRELRQKLDDSIKKNNLLERENERIVTLEEKCSESLIVINSKTDEINSYKNYCNELNEKIQLVLNEKITEITKLNKEKENDIKLIENNKAKEINEARIEINLLKEELFEIKLQLAMLKDNK